MRVTARRWGGLVVASGFVLVPCLVLLLVTGFDGLYGQDAYGYANYARDELLVALREGRLPPPFFFPPGYPLAIAAGALIGLDPDLVGLAVSVVAGATVPAAVGLLAWAVAPIADDRQRAATAIGAGLVAALTGQLWQSSVVSMSDTLALACATAGMVAALRYARAPRAAWLMVALALLVFAIETRLIYAGVAAAAIVPLLVGLRQRPPRHALRDATVGVAVALLVAAPMAVPIVDALARGAPAPFLGQLAVHGWDPLNALRSGFDTADGWLTYPLPTGAFYLAQPGAPYWFSAMALLVVPGLVVVLRELDPLRGAVLLVWPLLVIGFLAGGAYQNTRFFLAAMPPLAVLIATGGWSVWSFARRRWPGLGDRAVLAVLVVALVANAALAWRFTRNFIDRVSMDRAEVSRLVAELPQNAQVISLGATSLLRHDGRAATELTDVDPLRPADALSSDRPAYLLIQPAAVQGQWTGRQPEQAFDALDRALGLNVVGSDGPWTLYIVGHL